MAKQFSTSLQPSLSEMNTALKILKEQNKKMEGITCKRKQPSFTLESKTDVSLQAG